MTEAIGRRAQMAIESRVFPGCVIGISRMGVREIMPFGRFRYGAQQAVSERTIYDLASVTKSIPLASLAALLIEAGTLSLEDKVVSHIPELHNDYGATIEDLLRYRVRGPRLSTLSVGTLEGLRSHVLERGFDGPPGAEHYTNLPAFVLGLILERAAGRSIEESGQRTFFGPLRMHDTTYFPRDIERAAPSEIDTRGEVRGLPHDESAYLFAKAHASVGHAGLFSTAPDLLAFLEALMSGAYPAVATAAERGLGWSVREPYFMGRHASEQAFGKTGFTGTSVLCDRERRIALVILSNRCYPTRPADTVSADSAINIFRRDIADLVFEAAEQL